MTETKITPIPDGPLKVGPAPTLVDDRGYAIDTKETAFLCRCGLSDTKPFCDGSHKDAGFTSDNGDARIRNTPITYAGTVEGVDVTVSYTPVLCSHAAECQRLHLAVFNPDQKPWVQPESGTLAGIRAAVYACPSGALRLAEGGAAEQLGPDPVTADIRVTKDGPLAVRNTALEAEFNGAGASEQKFVLCRCGHSSNKPFCDGSHHDEGWTDGA